MRRERAGLAQTAPRCLEGPFTPSPVPQGGPGGADGGGADGQAAASPPPAAVQVTSRVPPWLADGDVAWDQRGSRERQLRPEGETEPLRPRGRDRSDRAEACALPSGTCSFCRQHRSTVGASAASTPRPYVSCFHLSECGKRVTPQGPLRRPDSKKQASSWPCGFRGAFAAGGLQGPEAPWGPHRPPAASQASKCGSRWLHTKWALAVLLLCELCECDWVFPYGSGCQYQ